MIKLLQASGIPRKIKGVKVSADWAGWGNNRNQPVAMTKEHAESLVNAVVEAVVDRVTRAGEGALIEQYKQFARLEAELTAARAALVSRDTEILSLRAHITSLNGFVANMVPVPGAPLFPPQQSYNNTGALPVQSPSLALPITTHQAPYSTIPNMPSLPPLVDNGPMKNSSSTS